MPGKGADTTAQRFGRGIGSLNPNMREARWIPHVAATRAGGMSTVSNISHRPS